MTRVKLVSISCFLILIKGFLTSNLVNLIMVFRRKYRWPDHYSSIWSLGNSQKLLKRNQFLISTILFTIMNISFFSLRFDLFSIIAKEANQIRNNVVCVVARLLLLCTHYGPLQCFST